MPYVSRFIWVDGSPSAAENPPHDRRWRSEVSTAARGQPPAIEVQLDFLLEPGRYVIDLDNLVRLALDGLRDAGTLSRGLVGLDTILATKRVAPPLGLGMTLVSSQASETPHALHEAIELVVEADVIPREGKFDEKRAWREMVRASFSGSIGRGPVALDIVARTAGSLVTLLKPVIDGLESYLGRGTIGRGNFMPLDERIVTLRARRDANLPVALRVIAGIPLQSPEVRIAPPAPTLPEMDPQFTWSTSDLERIDGRSAWLRIFGESPGWRTD